MKTSNITKSAVAAAMAVSSIATPAMAVPVQPEQPRQVFAMDANGNLLLGGILSDDALRAKFGAASLGDLEAAAAGNKCCGNGTCCNKERLI